MLSRFMASPTKIQFWVAKQVLRYLARTRDLGIQYNSNIELKLEGFVDSDWCGDIQDRKNTLGFVFNLGSGAVCWSSKKQTNVALSTTEVEYGVLCAACCHGVWMKKILLDCGVKCEGPSQLWCDNKSYIAIAKNPTLHSRTKHVDVKSNYIQDLVTNKEVQVSYCNIDTQIADIFH